MNEQSITARSAGANGGGNWAAVKRRALVFSITTTRGSWRSFQASCPRPTSTAKTFAAPCWSRQSVNPPVDAPRSSATQSGHVELKMLERVFEFVAAAADVFFAGLEREGVIGFDRVTGFKGGLGVDADLAGEDGAFGFFAAFAKAAFNQRLIEAGHGIDRRRLSSKAATVTSGRYWRKHEFGRSRKLWTKMSLSATAFSTSCLSRNISELLTTAWTLCLKASIGTKV